MKILNEKKYEKNMKRVNKRVMKRDIIWKVKKEIWNAKKLT